MDNKAWLFLCWICAWNFVWNAKAEWGQRFKNNSDSLFRERGQTAPNLYEQFQLFCSLCSFLSLVHFWYGPKIPRPTLCIEFITVMDQFSYLSKGQGFTKDTLEDVTDADDLWLQTREMKKPSKNPRTMEETPVTTAIVIACKRIFKTFSLI